MLNVASTCRAKDFATPYKDKDGRELLIVVVKYSFVVDANDHLHDRRGVNLVLGAHRANRRDDLLHDAHLA